MPAKKKISSQPINLCKDCKFYKPINAEEGDCFGYTIQGTRNASSCPTGAFTPR